MLKVSDSISRAVTFNEFKETLYEKLGKVFDNQSMVKEVANQILLSSLQVSNPETLKDKLDVKIKTTSNKYIKELHMYCYSYALKLSSDPVLAQDVSQEALLALFRNSENVTFIKGWLKSTVYHQVLTTWRKKKQNKDLITKLEQQAASHQDISAVTEKDLLENLPSELVKKLLTDEEFQRSEIINSYNNLKEYAEAERISYYTARKHRHIIYRNLKAAYLNSQGWKANPEMLSFKQYNNLRRFIKTLVEASNNNQIDNLTRYCSEIEIKEIEKDFSLIHQISDWGVKIIDKDTYYLVISDKNQKMISVLMQVKVPTIGSIKILSCKLNKCMAVIKNPMSKKLPLHNKGQLGMTIDELKKYLAEE